MSTPVVLALRALGLGDLVTGLPALRLLRDALPDHRIVLAAPACWTPLLTAAGTVDDILDTGELAPLRNPPVAPDLAVDLHGNGPASRRVLAVTGPRRLLAYAGGGVTWQADEHETARWCRLLREGLPLPAGPDPGLAGLIGDPPVRPELTGRTVVHCGAAAASRRWPPTRFAAVATLLAGEGHGVVVTAGHAERDLAVRIAAAAEVPVCVQPDVTELLALVGSARIVVSGDTGIAHLAALYGRPSVTLFGPVSPTRWGPPPLPRHQVLWHGDGHGDPHGTRTDPALLRITVGEVVAAAHLAGRAP